MFETRVDTGPREEESNVRPSCLDGAHAIRKMKAPSFLLFLLHHPVSPHTHTPQQVVSPLAISTGIWAGIPAAKIGENHRDEITRPFCQVSEAKGARSSGVTYACMALAFKRKAWRTRRRTSKARRSTLIPNSRLYPLKQRQRAKAWRFAAGGGGRWPLRYCCCS